LAEKLLLAVASLCFFIGIVFSITKNPDLLDNLQWEPVALIIIICIPFNIFLNAFEFVLIGVSVQKKIFFFKALKISIIGSAANMLPIPGGAITRVVWLKSVGSGYKESTLITFIFALNWIGVSFLVAGTSMLLTNNQLLGLMFLSGGIGTVAISFIVINRKADSFRIACGAFFQRTSLVILDALRIWLCFKSFGIDINISQAGVFVVSGVLGSAISIVPAGLGIREGISALLAPLVGLNAASGFVTAALNRILSLIVLSPLALILGLKKKK